MTTTSATSTSSIEAGDFPSWTLHVQIMPFEDAKTYRFNPFDLTKVWPHDDYPLHEVGKMTLNRNVVDYHAQIEQAAFEPNNIVPGTGLSPDKMLLARGFSYSDAHRARLGVNYKQIPVNEPHTEVRAYSKDGAMRIRNATDPVYTPNSMGGPEVDPKRAAEVHWAADGEMVRTAYALRQEDDDLGQAGTMVREVLDDEARDRLAHNIIGHVSKGVKEPVLSRVFEYWQQRRSRSRQEGRGGRARRRLSTAALSCGRPRACHVRTDRGWRQMWPPGSFSGTGLCRRSACPGGVPGSTCTTWRSVGTRSSALPSSTPSPTARALATRQSTGPIRGGPTGSGRSSVVGQPTGIATMEVTANSVDGCRGASAIAPTGSWGVCGGRPRLSAGAWRAPLSGIGPS